MIQGDGGGGVTPCVGVWIETYLCNTEKESIKSHPAWVCGLKLQTANASDQTNKSHPAWVCGLKLEQLRFRSATFWSHPAWVCGLKPGTKYRISSDWCHTLRGCVD